MMETRGTEKPIVAVSMGDPLGIGPEIIVKALADRAVRSLARFHVFGIESVLSAAAQRAGIEPYWWKVRHDSHLVDTALVHEVVVRDYPEFDRFDDAALTHPDHSKLGGEASFRFVEDAITAAQLKKDDPLHAAAIVTAPISKTSWDLAGHSRFPGHTELLAARFHSKRTAMLFVGPMLRVILVTIHVPLAQVPGLLSIGRVHDAIELGNEACVRLGVSKPRVAVCGLNPHAGEGGRIGDEDQRVIEPAIKMAQSPPHPPHSPGINVKGPFPADTIFLAAVKGEYDLVVAMYHDQGLIPVKLVDRERAVNVTVGLGTAIRTSPAHGTAFDIAGRNKASEASMRAAIELAVGMARG
jgi:4-phospho-D-threonate 3-dehydrogenase / 4-phospho-D-erythronate 3-dehydrogenase